MLNKWFQCDRHASRARARTAAFPSGRFLFHRTSLLGRLPLFVKGSINGRSGR